MEEMTELNPMEKQRIYFFPNGEKIVLVEVTHFLARQSGSHRLKTNDGKLHIVPLGWIHIEIDVESFTV